MSGSAGAAAPVTLAGEDHLLRERVIGSEVFGRRPDYEPGEDPVVRLRAAEVRKRLAQFHQSAIEAPEIHIDIPPGCYRATFRRSDVSHASPHEAEPAARAMESEPQPFTFTPDQGANPPAAISPTGFRNRTRLIGAAIAFILVEAVVVLA
ncbi:hypothetical protein [Granulicella sp. L60]|uniref:hypothetical protein n=1 Tax=Granulicella sp. L60 TaxID=1641866 RepID=UPI00131AB2E9|nr:hypothetical protein [Granulicella sp. L60]